MTSRFILYTLSSTFRAYKKERLPSAAWMRHNTINTTVPLSSCSRVSLSQSSARGVLGEQASRTTVYIVTPAQVFGEHLCDCSLLLDDCRRCLLLSRIVYFPVDVQRDCTRNIILHRLWFATSSNTQCRLV
jgi:hypothetical protein